MPDNPFHATARLCFLGAGDLQYGLLLTRVTHTPALFETLTQPGGVSAILSHDKGVVWPDPGGIAIAVSVLEAGGAAMLAFADLADALKAKARIDGGAPA
jgi:hypothetical protein